MKITILGTGDTVGTPRVGCDCGVCTLATEEGRSRLRTSFLIENEGKNILIDTSPDLKEQLIRTGAPKIGAVLWTHAHYDHIAGFNEFYRVQDFPPAYTPEKVPPWPTARSSMSTCAFPAMAVTARNSN